MQIGMMRGVRGILLEIRRGCIFEIEYKQRVESKKELMIAHFLEINGITLYK